MQSQIDTLDRITLQDAESAKIRQSTDKLGWVATAVIGLGGVLYTIGAVIYARRRPDPLPAVFGYHEVFHGLTIAGAACHYAVIGFWVLPLAQ